MVWSWNGDDFFQCHKQYQLTLMFQADFKRMYNIVAQAKQHSLSKIIYELPTTLSFYSNWIPCNIKEKRNVSNLFAIIILERSLVDLGLNLNTNPHAWKHVNIAMLSMCWRLKIKGHKTNKKKQKQTMMNLRVIEQGCVHKRILWTCFTLCHYSGKRKENAEKLWKSCNICD